MRQLHAIVHGHVQGVSFRYYTQRRAQALGVTGWVRNLPAGTVEVIAEGTQQQLDELIAFLRQGPAGACVTALDVDWLPASGQYADFNIRAYFPD